MSLYTFEKFFTTKNQLFRGALNILFEKKVP